MHMFNCLIIILMEVEAIVNVNSTKHIYWGGIDKIVLKCHHEGCWKKEQLS